MNGDCLLIRSWKSPTVITASSTFATTWDRSALSWAGLIFADLQAEVATTSGRPSARSESWGVRMPQRLHALGPKSRAYPGTVGRRLRSSGAAPRDRGSSYDER